MLSLAEESQSQANHWGRRLLVAAIFVASAVAFVNYALRQVNRSNLSEREAVFKKMSEGAISHVSRHCELPASIKPYDEIPVGGEKVFATHTGPELNPYQVVFQDPSYFAYQATRFLDGQALRIEARADFSPGGPQTVSYVFIEKTGECEARVVEWYIEEEFD